MLTAYLQKFCHGGAAPAGQAKHQLHDNVNQMYRVLSEALTAFREVDEVMSTFSISCGGGIQEGEHPRGRTTS